MQVRESGDGEGAVERARYIKNGRRHGELEGLFTGLAKTFKMQWQLFLVGISLAAAGSIDNCPGYKATDVVNTTNSLTATLTLAGDACNVYGNDITDLKLLVEYQSGDRLHVKIYDAAESVYQIPEALLALPTGGEIAASDSSLAFTYTAEPFSFAVQRSDTGETLFNTSGTSLIFESQYIRLRTSLPDDPYLYGLGEDSDPLRRPTSNYSRTFWNVGDAFLPAGSNLYGSHPIYIEMRNGAAHGVFLANSNGMDVKINRTDDEGQYLEYNAIGGVFDMYFLAGPTPSQVAQQYTGIVGLPAEVPFWAIGGFHQCKYGWQDAMMLAEVVLNYSTANIPLETLWIDIDYMDLRRTWTLDPDRFPLQKMQELATYLHSHGQHMVMMVDPPVALNDSNSYDAGLNDDVYIKHANGSVFVAAMWPGATSWVDWLHPNAQKFWSGQVSSFFDAQAGVDVDGIWLDMNDPANFCPYPCPDPVGWAAANNVPPAPPALRTTWPPLPGFPDDYQPSGRKRSRALQDGGNHTGLPDRDLLESPYRINNTDGELSANSIWTDLVQYGGYALYDTHNLFASGMIQATRSALEDRRPGTRPFIISRGTFAGSGNKTGHWTGDNASLWEQYRISIKQNMEFASIYQVPMVGADVCGFNLNTTETLCARWAVLGAWYPFYRNHADISANRQEFYLWPLVTEAAQEAIKTRMQLTDYFYTEFHYQSKKGTPQTILPLFYVYPTDPNTLENELQFFYGPSLLVSPVTDENSTSVSYYLPNDTFYDFFTGDAVTGKGAMVTQDNVNYTDIPVHIRGGSILPMRVDGANTTQQLRGLDFELLIAPDAQGNATGRLYLDDGESITPSEMSEITFQYDTASNTLSVDGSFGYSNATTLDQATILGVDGGNSTSSGRAGKTVHIGRPLSGAFKMQLG